MTLEKAIEILTLDLFENPKDPCCDLELATQLGIEALKRIKEQRSYRFSHMCRLLPEETKD